MIYSLAVMLIIASLDSVRSDNKWYTVEEEETTHLAIGDHRENTAADYSVKIKTKSVDNKSKVIQMAYLTTAEGKENGEIWIDFGINQVWIVYCQSKRVDLSQNTPIDAEKVWNIVRTAEPRIVVYCNGVEVFNYLLSDETCPYTWSKWSDAWMGTDIVGVKFDPIDRSYIAGYMIGSCDAGQFLDMETGCIDCPEGHWSENDDDVACTPCPGGKTVGSGLGKGESDCALRTCDAGQFLDMETGCTDCPEGYWSENDNDVACTPCPDGKTVGSGLGKGESDCAGTSTEENNHNYSHAVALKISSTLLVGLLFALIKDI